MQLWQGCWRDKFVGSVLEFGESEPIKCINTFHSRWYVQLWKHCIQSKAKESFVGKKWQPKTITLKVCELGPGKLINTRHCISSVQLWLVCRSEHIARKASISHYTHSESCFCEVDDKQCINWRKMLFGEFDNIFLIS